MTRRLYYDNSYLREFRASLEPTLEDPARVVLNQTAFYPTSGGQPFDTGTIGPAKVVDVIADDEEERIVHVLDQALARGEYDCVVDWGRRFDHMQQHTGQHLLSAMLIELLGMPTVSFHLGAQTSTIDIESAALSAEQVLEAEKRANEAVFENRPVTVSYHDTGEDIGLRKASGREGVIRVVSIDGLDRSACGGTHVRSTAEIGPLLIRKLDKIRGNVRIEFVCGMRAVRRARADYDGLSQVARTFTSSIEEAPALVAAQAERLAEADKSRRKLSAELAQIRGRELHKATPANGKGLKLHVRRVSNGPVEEDVRVEAQAFTACGGAGYVVLCENPPSVMLAVSPDAPLKAGPALKPLLEKNGGRGGGSPLFAQGSLPTRAALDEVERELLALLS
jgi:alanyl-tRNA synthetase